MAVRLNDTARAHAAGLIKAGKVDKTSSWSISADEENALLGPDEEKPDWAEYARWHLGIRTGVERGTKGAYAYPYGKGGKVYRSALIAIRSRSAQQAASAIFEAAGKLIAEIDGEEQVAEVASLASIGLHAGSAQELQLLAWESMAERVLQILPYGNVRAQDQHGEMGVYLVSERSLKAVVEAHAAREGQVCFDYRHSTQRPSAEPLSGLAAAWLWELWAVQPDADMDQLGTLWGPEARRAAEQWGPGIYGLAKLTPRASELVANREYRYFSPVFSVDEETLEVLSVEGGAFCNDPANGGLMPLAANDNPQQTVTGEARTQQDDHATGAAPAPPVPAEPTRSDTMGKIDGVDSEALSGLTGKTITDPKGVLAAVGELASDRQTLSQDRDRLAAENAALKTQLAHEAQERRKIQEGAERAARDQKIASYLDEAVAQGRLVAEARDGLLEVIDGDPAKAERLIASLPPAQQKPAGPKPPAPGRVTPGTTEEAKRLGASAQTATTRLVWAEDIAPQVRQGEQAALEAELATANPDYRGTEGLKQACRAAAVRLGRS